MQRAVKSGSALLTAGVLILALGACSSSGTEEKRTENEPLIVQTTEAPALPDPQPEETALTEEEADMLKMWIGETPVGVTWEENESVEALKELCLDGPLIVSLSMYGGFEQVGPIGTSLPRNDVQTRTEWGDIVLYAGNQLVVFYGSNSWAYTRLGHINDLSQGELTALLDGGDVTITLQVGD